MKRAENLIEDTKAHISQMKNDEQAQYNALEAVIAAHNAQNASRARLGTNYRASDLSGGCQRLHTPRMQGAEYKQNGQCNCQWSGPQWPGSGSSQSPVAAIPTH